MSAPRGMYICNTAHILLSWHDIRNAHMNKLSAIAWPYSEVRKWDVLLKYTT